MHTNFLDKVNFLLDLQHYSFCDIIYAQKGNTMGKLDKASLVSLVFYFLVHLESPKDKGMKTVVGGRE